MAIAAAGLGFLIPHPEGLFNPYSDLTAQHLGTQTILHQTWQSEHRLPLWRSDSLSGGPALTNPQSLYTHPLHLLFAMYRPERIVGLVVWLQMLVAALGAYYAGTQLRLSVPGRLVVAVSMLFSFKTILAAFSGWLPQLAGIAATPWLFGAAVAALERPSLMSALLLGAVGAFAAHAGHLQFIYYPALFITIWGVVSIGRRFMAGELQHAVRATGTLLLAVVVACGLSAYLMLPLARDAPLITRSASSYDFFLAGRPFPAVALLTLFHPELFGTPIDGAFLEASEYVCFVGAVTSLLAAVAVIRRRAHPLAPPLAAGVLLCVILAIPTPLLEVVHAVVPGYDLFRLPARVLFVAAFFASCLAGIGIDGVLSRIRHHGSRRTAAIVLIGLLALEGTMWARRYLRTRHPLPAVVAGSYIDSLTSGGQPARIVPLARSIPNYGSAAMLDVELITGYDPFNLRHYQTYLDLLRHNRPLGTRAEVWMDVDAVARVDMLAALNVLYVVSPRPVDLPGEDYVEAGSFVDQPQFRFYEGLRSGPVHVYRNRRFMPRAYFVSTVLSVPDEDGVIRAIQQTDVRETAVIAAGDAGASSAAAPGDRVETLRSAAGELDLATRSASRRFLVVSEIWHPGWHALVDDRPASLHRANVALMGLWLGPGEHRVELRFWPPGLTVGLVVSGLSALGVLGALASALGHHLRSRRRAGGIAVAPRP